MSFISRSSTDLANYVGRKIGLTSKLKVDASGKLKRKKVNKSIAAKQEQFEKNAIEQEVKDIQAKKDWERERDAGIEQMAKERNNSFSDDVQRERV